MNTIEVSIEVERPSSEELRNYDRTQRYSLLRENSIKHTQQIVTWLKNEGLYQEVTQVGEPTVFNQIFITSTPRVAQALKRAPGVLNVSGNPKLESSLPSPSDKLLP